MTTQDDNKKATVDFASLFYRSLLNSIMYVDRDELLFCPQAGKTILEQREYQQLLVEVNFKQGSDELLFPRFNYASVTSSPNIESDAQVTGELEDCLLRAYKQRAISAFWECYSSIKVLKSKHKSVFLPSACPFHDLHFACWR
jgi:hypothetical protein